MNKNRSALIIAIIIGGLCILFGLIQLFVYQLKVDYYLFFIGITIAGAAFIQLRKKDSKGKE